jgi:mannose-6-phosphate isomerase-like protein (cupin superfamily)
MLKVDRLVPLISADNERTFSVQGVLGPIRVLTPAECALLDAYVDNGEIKDPTTWFKGYACSDQLIYAIATRQNILDVVERLLGPDLYLWGASIVIKKPGEPHHWHTDIETSDPEGRFVSAWIGISNTSYKSALQFIEQSHLIGMPLQEVAARHGVSRIDRSAERSLALAERHRDSCSLGKKDIRDGEAFFFDGRLWHGSLNTDNLPRKALLLQYSANTSAVRIPNFTTLDHPFAYTDKFPPGLIVRGQPHGNGNVVSPPPREKKLSRPSVWKIQSDLSKEPFKPHYLFRGETAYLDALHAHFSVLQPGHSPHPPHKHIEEELLIVIDGVAQVIVGDSMTSYAITSGDFAYYPSYYQHTIRNESDRPIVYLMFKWRSSPLGLENQVGSGIYRDPSPISDPRDTKFRSKLIFEGPTHFLTKLHVHRSYVLTGGGYEPHVDDYDVLITLLDGKLTTMGKTIEAPALLCHPAGISHGLHSVGESPARYIVVEMHGIRNGLGKFRLTQPFLFTGWRRAPQHFRRLLLSHLRQKIPSPLRQKIRQAASWIIR